ncbi:serine hydrolase [Curtobacterium flaccumfaciens]|nr:serine hydrolase [Curtobacterium flaccumfaciens]
MPDRRSRSGDDDDDVPRTTPSALDVDARGVLAFVDAIESTPGVEPHSFMLLRHGQVAAGGWWQPYSADRVHLLYSLSKSFTAAAVGIAVRQGLVDLGRDRAVVLPGARRRRHR